MKYNEPPNVVQELMLTHLASGMRRPTQAHICERLKIHQSSFYLLFYSTLKQYAVDNDPSNFHKPKVKSSIII